MKALIGTSVALSMFLSAFMCVGMGLDLGVSSPFAHADHSCCPSTSGETPDNDAERSASCCLDLPGINGGSVSAPKHQRLLVANSASIRGSLVAASFYSGLAMDSGPLIPESGHLFAGTSRAPPAV